MTLGSLFVFAFTVYLFVIVGRSVWNNYNSNKQIGVEELKLVQLQEEISNLSNQINYYQTYSYKEKEARAKLGYKRPGENMIILPLDSKEDKVSDQQPGEVKIKTENYRLWWEYFFGN